MCRFSLAWRDSLYRKGPACTAEARVYNYPEAIEQIRSRMWFQAAWRMACPEEVSTV
jgi:hypothetical protein